MLSPYPWQCLITLSTSINLRDTYLHVLSIYLTDVCFCADRKTQKKHETHIQLPLFRCGHTTRDRKHNLVDHLDEGQGCVHTAQLFLKAPVCLPCCLPSLRRVWRSSKRESQHKCWREDTMKLKREREDTINFSFKIPHGDTLVQHSEIDLYYSSTPVKQTFQ